jgi:hypothetical protein
VKWTVDPEGGAQVIVSSADEVRIIGRNMKVFISAQTGIGGLDFNGCVCQDLMKGFYGSTMKLQIKRRYT